MQNLRTATLENGLQVLLLESHTAPVATFWVWYRVGSRNERPGLTGISHWVEHMLFKGTPTHPKGDLSRYIDRLGGRWNAFTWKDYTAYHEVLPAEHLPVAVRLEADRMVNTIFDPAEVESERTVIISEREGSENFPSYLLHEEVDAAAHKVHPYRVPVIGWKDDLRAITRDDLFQHYRTYYHPTNAIAVAVGAFDVDGTLDLIRQSFGSIPPGPPLPAVRAREPEQEGERRIVLQRPGGATGYLHLAYHIPHASHPDLAVLLVLDGVLSGFKSVGPFGQGGGGRSSRLYRALVETQLASEVSSSVVPAVDPTLFRIVATARAGVDVPGLEAPALAELERLAREPVSPGELAKVKKQAKAQFVFAQDGVFRTALALGAFAVVDGPDAFPALLEHLDRVSPDDIMRTAATYFTHRHRTVGWYLPSPGGGAAPAPPAARHPGVFWFTSGSQAAPAVPITPDTVTRTELHNGLAILTHEQRGSGMVAVAGYVKAGAMYDGEHAGLARFAAALLQRGTQTRTSQEIAETIEAMGATLSIFPNQETVAVGLQMLREDAKAVLEILADLVIRPSFPSEEVEKVRGQLLTALRIAQQDTRAVADRTFRKLLYPAGHPHARMMDGDEEAVAALGRDDLLAFYRAHYRPEATVLAVVGDLSAAEVLDVTAQSFSGWERGGIFRLPAVPPIVLPDGPARGDVRLPGKIQSDIALGGPGVARSDPAYYETMMANLILGQLGMMGRLGDRVRERQGMAYYAYSDLRAGLLAGPWWVRAGVNPRNESRAIESIVEEVRAFRSDGPSDHELADARSFLVGSLAVRLETTAGVAQTLADIELFRLGLDHVARYPQIITSLTREGIAEAAQTFELDRRVVAIAGPSPAS